MGTTNEHGRYRRSFRSWPPACKRHRDGTWLASEIVPPWPPSSLCPSLFQSLTLAGVVLASLARLLGLHEGRFVGMMDEGVGAMAHARFNYYPRCPEPDRVFGLRPHSDVSVVTIVLIDDAVGGLQVQKPNDDGGGAGIWYDVPIVPNALLVNVGDLVEIMSNGFFRSPVHRAVTNAESDQVSLAMFYTLDPEMEIEPLPELVDDRPRRYRKTTTKEYLAVLFEKFARGERAMDTVKTDLKD